MTSTTASKGSPAPADRRFEGRTRTATEAVTVP
jgi:hypothetical protein